MSGYWKIFVILVSLSPYFTACGSLVFDTTFTPNIIYFLMAVLKSAWVMERLIRQWRLLWGAYARKHLSNHPTQLLYNGHKNESLIWRGQISAPARL